MSRPIPGSALHRVLLLVAVVVTAILVVLSIEHAPVRAYGAIERQGQGF